MQDRVSRSLGESSRSSNLQHELVASDQDAAVLHQRNVSWNLQRSVWILLSAISFGALIVCSELVVTSFRVQAADPTNGSLDSVLLDFTAKWCGPCQQMSPIVSRLERQNFPIRKVDIDAEPLLARQFKVDSIPCFVLVVNGREINRITGATNETELRRLLAMLPRQNIDDTLVAGNSKQNSSNNKSGNATKSPDEKKPFLKMPQLFNRNQDKDRDQDLALIPTTPDTVRGQNPPQDSTSEDYARDPMQVSVRIRVNDGNRLHYGSGTIIDSQPGRSVVLTCGHIFRDLGKDASIEVDYFTSGNGKPQTAIGQVLRYDLKSDLGLITLPTKNQLPVIHLGFAQSPPAAKDRVVSIGCGGGERPTREDHRITAVNRYVAPDNIECDGVPQQGRSGGGLFAGAELIGVCIAADPKDKRGIYTSIKPVAQLLEKAQLSHLLPSRGSSDNGAAELTAQAPEATLGNAVGMNEEQPPRTDEDLAGILEAATRGNGNQVGAVGDYVGSEIVCIVRPKTPGATTRVVIVNQASSRFISDLLHEPSCGARGDGAATAQSSATRKAANRTGKTVDSSPRAARSTPAVDDADFEDADGPIETSFETQRYRRKRD